MDENQQFGLLDVLAIAGFTLQLMSLNVHATNDDLLRELRQDTRRLSDAIDHLTSLIEGNNTDAEQHPSSAQ